MSKEYKGYNGILVLNDNNVVIKRGVRGFLLGGGFLRGDKTIPYASIVAVQLKRAVVKQRADYFNQLQTRTAFTSIVQKINSLRRLKS